MRHVVNADQVPVTESLLAGISVGRWRVGRAAAFLRQSWAQQSVLLVTNWICKRFASDSLPESAQL